LVRARHHVDRPSHATFLPGFMSGLSGIGYGLLRLAEPAALPSILSWE